MGLILSNKKINKCLDSPSLYRRDREHACREGCDAFHSRWHSVRMINVEASIVIRIIEQLRTAQAPPTAHTDDVFRE